VRKKLAENLFLARINTAMTINGPYSFFRPVPPPPAGTATEAAEALQAKDSALLQITTMGDAMEKFRSDSISFGQFISCAFHRLVRQDYYALRKGATAEEVQKFIREGVSHFAKYSENVQKQQLGTRNKSGEFALQSFAKLLWDNPILKNEFLKILQIANRVLTAEQKKN
jgi:hypothetical protein